MLSTTVKRLLFSSNFSKNNYAIRTLSAANKLVKNAKKFNDLKIEHIKRFQQIIGKNGVKTEDLDAYNTDWLKMHKGKSKLVLLPNTVEQLSKTLKFCNDNDLYVVIQAGNTGLVAGATPINDEIIISTSKLNKIISFDEISGVLISESGCVLQDLEEYVNERNHIMPYDLGAKGSCQIGGNLATNAGGLRVIKYGNLHGSILGLEVVLMNGEIVNMMSSMRKDNTGYDLKQLFIGSEGTLGVITKNAILCPIKPINKLVGVLAIKTFENLLQVFKLTRFSLNEYLSAFEMFDLKIVEIMEKNLKIKRPFDSNYLYVLIEMSGSSLTEMENQFCNLMEKLMNEDLIQNGTYSSDLSTMDRLWSMRERIAEGLLMNGYCFKYDVSIPLNDYYNLVEVMKERLKDNKLVTSVSGYGHIGDCNLHFTVTTERYEESVKNEIEPFIYEWVSQRSGSISAEHGLGLKKNNHILYSKSPEAVELMKKIKKILDPKLLLNPQKCFEKV